MSVILFFTLGQQSFERFRVVPPGTGICHQVNLEYLGKAIWSEQQNGRHIAYPDTFGWNRFTYYYDQWSGRVGLGRWWH